MNLNQLRDPFPEADIEWRIQRSGLTKTGDPWAMVLAYVDARAVQDRLDKVCGPENWKVNYEHREGGVVCSLSIKCGDEWVTKQDGSPETQIEKFKGGISKALVRAASVWGVGRYLYGLPNTWAVFDEQFKGKPGAKTAAIGEKPNVKNFTWIPPKLPMNFLTDKEQQDRRAKGNRSTKNNQNPQDELMQLKRDLKAICVQQDIDMKTQLKEIVEHNFPQVNFYDMKMHEIVEIIAFLEQEREAQSA